VARSETRRKRHEVNRSELDREWFVSSPDDRLDAIEAARELAELPSSQREVIVARRWGGLSFQEISELL
jgi:RNA polymerase sigma-70 factor (ECF subfamily)